MEHVQSSARPSWTGSGSGYPAEPGWMCDRLIEVSFAKILNSKHEKGGAKLHKNLLVLQVLQKARSEHRNRFETSRSRSISPPMEVSPFVELDPVPVSDPSPPVIVEQQEQDMPLFSPFDSAPLITSPLECGVQFVADPQPDASFYCSTPVHLISPLQSIQYSCQSVVDDLVANDDDMDADEDDGGDTAGRKQRHDSDSGISSGDSRSGSEDSDSEDSADAHSDDGSLSPPLSPYRLPQHNRKRKLVKASQHRRSESDSSDAAVELEANEGAVHLLIAAFNNVVGMPVKKGEDPPAKLAKAGECTDLCCAAPGSGFMGVDSLFEVTCRS